MKNNKNDLINSFIVVKLVNKNKQNHPHLRENILYSEILKQFDSSRPEFKPYGFTVEKWTPHLMPRPDRHNEIEINLLTGGSLTYLFNDKKITLHSGQLVVFWALIPHQIINIDNSISPYYVCTIPFAQFMNWQLPGPFVDQVLNGNVVTTSSTEFYIYDKYLMEMWLEDFSGGNREALNVSLLEICSRLQRFALHAMPIKWDDNIQVGHEFPMIDLVEKMIIYISRNLKNPIKNQDIGKAVGLSPDYANTIFKKSFGMTLNQYLLRQRILYVQRQLSVSNSSITEIAFEAGFNSLSRFNAAFMDICRCSPREYRKRHTSLTEYKNMV